jgi:hypothetical protein
MWIIARAAIWQNLSFNHERQSYAANDDREDKIKPSARRYEALCWESKMKQLPKDGCR